MPDKPRLLDQVRRAMEVRRYSPRTIEAYVNWVRRFVRYHGTRHPADLGSAEVGTFLTWLATRERVAAATQTQALCALLFLYRTVLQRPPEEFIDVVRARGPERIPVVLSRGEVRQLLAALEGEVRLICLLLYGAGLRLNECLQLRVKDVDFARGQHRAARRRAGALARASRPGEDDAPGGSWAWRGPSGAARWARAEAPGRVRRVALAVGVPGDAPVQGGLGGRAAAPPPA
jgi:integrase